MLGSATKAIEYIVLKNIKAEGRSSKVPVQLTDIVGLILCFLLSFAARLCATSTRSRTFIRCSIFTAAASRNKTGFSLSDKLPRRRPNRSWRVRWQWASFQCRSYGFHNPKHRRTNRIDKRHCKSNYIRSTHNST